MATEQKKVIDIETQGAQKSLSDLKKQINDAKNALYEMAEGSEEYNDKLQELGYAQQELTSFMNATRQGCASLEGSYNALSFQMSQLKQAYKETADAQERANLAGQISDINDQLKAMDAEVGVYSRNVGNYTGAMNETFSKLGLTVGNLGPIFNTLANSAAEAGAKGQSAFTGLATGAKTLGTSLKALAANPVGAVIMAIVVAVKALKAGFDAVKESIGRNEVAHNNLRKAMAPIKGIVDTIRNAFDQFVEVLTGVAAKISAVIGAIMDFLGIGNEMKDLEGEIAQMQEENDELHRQNIVRNSELELQASEARANAADKEKYTNEERLKFAKEYQALQLEIAKNNQLEAEKELELLQKQAESGKNNKEMNDKLAQAQAKVNQVQSEYNNLLRQTNKEINKINNEIASDTAAAHAKAAASAKSHADKVKSIRDNYNNLIKDLNLSGLTDFDRRIEQLNEEEKKRRKTALDNRNTYRKNDKKAEAEYQAALLKIDQWYNIEFQKIMKDRNKEIHDAQLEYRQIMAGDLEGQILQETEKWLQRRQKIIESYNQDLLSEKDKDKILKEYEDLEDKIIKEMTANFRVEQTMLGGKYALDTIIKSREISFNDLEQRYAKHLITTKEYNDEMAQIEFRTNRDQMDRLRLLIDLIRQIEPETQTQKDKILELEKELGELINAQTLLIQKMTDDAKDVWKNAVMDMIDLTNEFMSNITSIGDGISSEWTKVGDNMMNVMQSVIDMTKNGEKAWKNYAKIGQQSCMVVSSVFGALADEQDEESREGFEKAKALRIAEAVFSTASGIISVWPAAMELGLPAGPIAAGALSALIGTIGALQIKKIRDTQFNDNGSSSSATPSASGISMSLQAPVQYSQDVPNAMSEVETDNRVYVLESDIRSVGSRVRTAEAESTF